MCKDEFLNSFYKRHIDQVISGGNFYEKEGVEKEMDKYDNFINEKVEETDHGFQNISDNNSKVNKKVKEPESVIANDRPKRKIVRPVKFNDFVYNSKMLLFLH